MKAAVIGAAGRMGSWFTQYFTEKGFETTVYDADPEKLKKVVERYRARQADDLSTAVIDADVVLISIPIPATAKMVSDISKMVKDDAVVVEITSLKKNIIDHLKSAGNRRVKILSIHPMFGHGVRSLSGHKIVVIQVKNLEREVAATKELFPEADVVSAKAEEHDEAMATIISLTHFVNFVYASTLPKNQIEKIRRLSGTSFNLQLTLTESILHDDPEFLATLQIDNRYASQHLDRFVKQAETLKDLVSKKDRETLINHLKTLNNTLKKQDKHYGNSYKKMYGIMEILLDE